MANLLNNRAEHRKNGKKARLPLSAWLVYLLVAALAFGGGSLARYTTTASGTATARVAKFDVAATEVTGQAQRIDLTAGDASSTGTYQFSVTNNSEVLVKYSVIVSGVPANVKATLGTQTLTSNGSGTLTFTAEELGIGKKETCTLTFYALEGAETQTAGVTIQVHVEQVD
ncbi:MAG: hypothetical protein ACI3V3_06685 [Faecousia sp.]